MSLFTYHPLMMGNDNVNRLTYTTVSILLVPNRLYVVGVVATDGDSGNLTHKPVLQTTPGGTWTRWSANSWSGNYHSALFTGYVPSVMSGAFVIGMENTIFTAGSPTFLGAHWFFGWIEGVTAENFDAPFRQVKNGTQLTVTQASSEFDENIEPGAEVIGIAGVSNNTFAFASASPMVIQQEQGHSSPTTRAAMAFSQDASSAVDLNSYHFQFPTSVTIFTTVFAEVKAGGAQGWTVGEG
jgi:hypothetical protein